MPQDQPEVRVRRRREFETFLAHFVIVAPSRPDIHDRRLQCDMKIPDWEPGRWNYNEEEYGRLVKAKQGYVYFRDFSVTDEPGQDVFDAVCTLLREEHDNYMHWYHKRLEKAKRTGDDKYWPDPYPLELPKGTARLDMDIDDPDYVAHWVTTDRPPSE